LLASPLFLNLAVPALPFFDAYQSLPLADQFLHSLHFVLCALAVVVACAPLRMEKGSPEHKAAGMVYLPLSLIALLLGSVMAWREHSLVLFCFDSFCAYLLLSGWRAVHEKDAPDLLDWVLPSSLFVLAVAVTMHALFYDEGRRSLYLLVFALNAFYLCRRDFRHLKHRAGWHRNRVFLAALEFSPGHESWMSRHIAGMAGSAIANLSVVVLTLLPLRLHWLWPVTLILGALWIAYRQKAKKRRLRPTRVFAPVFQTASSPKSR
jgi:hypothetical protein